MTKHDYSSLYEALDYRFDPDKIKTSNQLKELLRAYGFFNGVKTQQGMENILAESWNHLKGETRFIEQQKGITRERIKKDGRQTRKTTIVNYDVKFEDKTYKKGDLIEDELPKIPYKYVVNRGVPVKQATLTIKIDGKWYRKGQFIPKKFRFD